MLLRSTGSLFTYRKTTVAWWVLGKEHRELSPLADYGLRANSPAIVQETLNRKISRYKEEKAHEWRFYQVEEDLIVEKQRLPATLYYEGPDTRNFYLVKRGLVVQENCHFSKNWFWKLHIADIYFEAEYDSWIMKDLLVNVLVHPNGVTHRVIDLDALAEGIEIGLLAPSQAAEILHRVQKLVNQLDNGEFPFYEVVQARQACKRLGWD